MIIRDNAQQIVKMYQDAIPALRRKANSSVRMNQLDRAEKCLSQIQEFLANVTDGSSSDAAKLQMQICTALEIWGREFGNENFEENVMVKLSNAASLAQSWSKLPALGAKKRFLLFSKAPKEAEPDSYLTYENAIKNPTHRRILVLSQYLDAVNLVEQLSTMIQEKRANDDVDIIMKIQSALDRAKQERIRLHEKLDPLCKRYKIAQQSGAEIDSDLSAEMVETYASMKKQESMIESYQKQIDLMKLRVDIDAELFSKIERLYFFLQSQIYNESSLVSLTSHINLDALRRIFENTATPEDMTSFVDFNVLNRMAAEFNTVYYL